MKLSVFLVWKAKWTLCANQLQTSNPPPPPPSIPGNPGAFELLKIGSFKFLHPRAKMVFDSNTLPYRRICLLNPIKVNGKQTWKSLTNE